jgi:hypothetical protein
MTRMVSRSRPHVDSQQRPWSSTTVDIATLPNVIQDAKFISRTRCLHVKKLRGWCWTRRVLHARTRCSARQGARCQAPLGEKPTAIFVCLKPRTSTLRSLSPTYPHLSKVCLSRRRVPFREPGEVIAPVRKDERDTASPLRQELKNPHVCTLRALSTLWHLEANHNFFADTSVAQKPLRIFYNRQNGQDFRSQRLPQCHQQRREGWQAPSPDPPVLQGHCQVPHCHAEARYVYSFLLFAHAHNRCAPFGLITR